MPNLTYRSIVLAVLMLGASALSVLLTPSVRIISEVAQLSLETLIPRQFGDWQVSEQTAQAVVNPQTEVALNEIYSQILTRVYTNKSTGRSIMLSLAYGEDQSHKNQIHKPEVCYPAQGFRLANKEISFVHMKGMNIDIPVMRIEAELGHRHEPVTYWIRIGDSLVRGAIEQSYTRIRYGLSGRIPDGLLFRISEINSDSVESFAFQDQFIHALLLSLTPTGRYALIGSLGLTKLDQDGTSP